MSSVIPCMIKDSNQPMLKNIKQVFFNNKELILTNSLILGITVYIALKIAPSINSQFPNLLESSSESSSSSDDITNFANNFDSFDLKDNSYDNNPTISMRRIKIPPYAASNPFKLLAQL
jgi:predicted PurR-regulated permease PerM